MIPHRIALYLRLSKKDEAEEGEDRESNSIGSQRELLRSSLKKYGLDEREVLEYVDDGFSGKNFQRPAVKRLLQDAEEGRIHTILVKDFSRFGRDHVAVSDYMEKIFPLLNIRFIAVSQGFDSQEWNERISSLDMAFQNILNDYYSEESSVKIKRALKTCQREGSCLASIPLYGYRKSEQDHHKLLIDEPAAQIVRRIFQYRLEGLNGGEIARKLNAEEVESPIEYLQRLGMAQNHRLVKQGKQLWQAAQINQMLRNREYTGCLIGGRYGAKETGSRKVKQKEPENWIVSENRQEAIISKEIFEKAQAIRKESRKSSGKTKPKEYYESPLKGLVWCGGCGHRITRKAQKTPSYYCKYYYYDYNDSCVESAISEKEVEKIVIQAIRARMICMAEPDLEQLYEVSKKQIAKKQAEVRRELQKHQRRMEQWKRENFELYVQYRDEKISREKYLAKKKKSQMWMETEKKRIGQLTDKLTESVRQQKKVENGKTLWAMEGKAVTGESLQEEWIRELVAGIYVYSNCRVSIKFRFIDSLV